MGYRTEYFSHSGLRMIYPFPRKHPSPSRLAAASISGNPVDSPSIPTPSTVVFPGAQGTPSLQLLPAVL